MLYKTVKRKRGAKQNRKTCHHHSEGYTMHYMKVYVLMPLKEYIIRYHPENHSTGYWIQENHHCLCLV